MQELANRIVSIVTDEKLLQVFYKGVEAKSTLVAFARIIAESHAQIEDAESDREFKLLWNHEGMKTLKEAVSDMYGLARAIVHFFCAPVPYGVQETTDQDVYLVSKFAGHSSIYKAGYVMSC